MSSTATLIIVLNAVSATSSALLAAYAFRNRKHTASLLFAALMTVYALWGGLKLLSFFVDALATQILLTSIIRGISLFTPMLVVSIVTATGRLMGLPARVIRYTLFAFGTVLALLSLTEGLHGIFIQDYRLITFEGLFFLRPVFRYGRSFNLPYLYASLGISVAFLASALVRNPPYFRLQSVYLLIAVLLPAVNDGLYRFGFSLIPGYHLTPEFFIVGNVFFAIAIFNYGFLRLVPIARSTIVDSLDDIMITFEDSGFVLDVNRRCEQIFSIRCSNVQGRSFRSAFGNRIDYDALSRGAPELRIVVDGEERHYSVRYSCIDVPVKESVVITALLSDITEEMRRKVELAEYAAELKLANETKDKLFAIIAHDLKGPMASQLGFIEVIQEQHQAGEELDIARNCELLRSSTKNLLTFLENLLIWALNQRGELGFNPMPHNLHAIAQRNLELLRRQAEHKNIRMENVIDPNLEALCDREMIDIVIRNLLSNALKFSPSGGLVRVWSEVDAATIIIKTSDTGVGIVASLADSLFDPERIVDSVQGTAGERGTGMGLALCAEFVLRHGGTIGIDRSEPGQGTVIAFTLPRG